MFMGELTEPFNTPQLQEMERYLAAADNPDEVMTLPMACGYIHGVVITPVVGSPFDWIPEIFGRALPEQEAGRFPELVTCFTNYYNAQLAAFYDQRLCFPFSYNDLDKETVNAVYQWVYGLHLALQVNLPIWLQEDDPFVRNEELDDVSQALFYVQCLADPDSVRDVIHRGDSFDPTDSAKIAKLLAAMPASVEVLTRYGLKLNKERIAAMGAAGPAPAGRKIGRNEPCPCGSGKKYKKCCARRVF
jgi:uncharacterized protein